MVHHVFTSVVRNGAGRKGYSKQVPMGVSFCERGKPCLVLAFQQTSFSLFDGVCVERKGCHFLVRAETASVSDDQGRATSQRASP
jgi:hypothetical protein